MNKKQSVLLELLKELDVICRENDIKYTLAGGTMLGAVRHGGFIPWDDDADIVMSKSNFDKLKAYFDNTEIKNRKLVHRWDYENYPMIIARYYQTDNTGLQRASAWDKTPAGQYVDIFIMIPLPNDPVQKKKVVDRIIMYVELNNDFYCNVKNCSRSFYFKYRTLNAIKRIIGKKRLLGIMEKRIYCFPDEGCDEYMISHAIGSPLIYSNKYFNNPLYVDFEDTKLPVTENYMELIWYGYGSNWRFMPPPHLRGLHKVYDDFNRPYKLYTEDYLRFIDQEKIIKDLKQYKADIITRTFKRGDLLRQMQEWKLQKTAVILKKKIDSDGIDTDELLKKHNFRTVNKLFETYYAEQLNSESRSLRAFCDIDDRMLKAACMNLICYRGEYYNALFILGLREERKGDLGDELIPVKALCAKIEKMYHDFDFGTSDDVKNTIAEFEYGDDMINVVLAKLRLRAEELDTAENAEQMIEYAEAAIDRFPHNWDLYKYIADAELHMGNTEKALKIYDIVEDRTVNGELLKDIQEKKRLFP